MNVKTIPSMIEAAALRHGQRAAIVDGDTRIDYADLARLGRQVARALVHRGVRSGERVGIWAPNVFEWILAAVGTHMAGAVLVPINTRMKGEEAADILGRSRARVLFCIGEFLGVDYPAMLAPLRPATLEHLVLLRRGSDWQDFLAEAEHTPANAIDQRIAALTEDSISDLMFTSGTTGRPKAVMSAHGPTLRAFEVWSRVVDLAEGDRYLIVNPFFHSFGYKAGWVAAFLRGATVYPLDVFDAGRVMAAIARDRVSFLPGPPTLYQTLLAHPKLAEYDLSSLRCAVTGAATVPPVLIERMRRDLGFARVTTAYGLTECGGVATINSTEDTAERIATTCGKALPGTELRIADEQGHPLPAGRSGEVLLRGYHVMRGYFEDDQATAEAIDADGWLHTGDVGVLDEQGYLRITDRLKDLYIVGGFNCYPAEIERMLAEHPAIAQVAVVGVPDERMGEVGCACVQLRPGATLSSEELIAWSRERMANYKVPRHVLLLDSFPMTASNKVQKRQLSSQILDQLR